MFSNTILIVFTVIAVKNIIIYIRLIKSRKQKIKCSLQRDIYLCL